MTGKLRTMQEAIAEHVDDGSTVAIEGFTAGICFAAAHEIIRQRRTDLTLVRMTPDLVYDQMVAAGCARNLVFSYLGNPGVGSLRCIRRAIERGVPVQLEWEEYTHYGMIGRYIAGAAGLPFYPLRSFAVIDDLASAVEGGQVTSGSAEVLQVALINTSQDLVAVAGIDGDVVVRQSLRLVP